MFFQNCNTIEELKKEYRKLAMMHHPDRGGNLETMQVVNAEYDRMFNLLKDKHNTEAAADESGKSRTVSETPEEFRAVIDKIINLRGLVIELCGSWVWISGNTMEHREALKACGCRWASKKKMWYWRCDRDAVQSRGAKSMDYIRSKYGSERISNDNERLTA